MITRNITESILSALSDSPVVLLNGARQTGKSTLVQQLGAGSHLARYVTLDDVTVLSAIKQDPAGFLSGIAENLIIDEIQRAPELFLAIKAQVDRNRSRGRYLLTGSANALLLPRVADSLAGRMEILTLYPFSQGEVEGRQEHFIDTVYAKDFSMDMHVNETRADLYKRILTGGYPETLQRPSPDRRAAWFGSYITSILQRDIRDLANIEGLTLLPRLLYLLASRTASLLNFAELSRSCGLSQTTLRRYMALLETTFLVHVLPAWSGNLGKRFVKTPKLHMCDSGLAAYLIGASDTDTFADHQISGRLLENFVLMELLKQAGWSNKKPRFFHFRTQSGHEVDIVMEDASGKVVGIEVKASASLGEKDYRALRLFSETVGSNFHRGVLFYTGMEVVPFGPNLFALPVQALWME